MDDIERKARGQRAESLLRDDLLQEALREVRYAAHRAFEAAKGEPDKLARAAMQLEAAAEFHRFLILAATHGAAAAKKIDRELQGGGFVRGVGRLVRNRSDEAEGMPWSMAR